MLPARALTPLIAACLLALGCQSQDTPPPEDPAPAAPAPKVEPAKTAAPPTPAKPTPAATTSGGKIVFDPRNPPPGFTKCHRNHCHRVGGGVASYRQVMDEIGATEIVGGKIPTALPPAPADVGAPPADAEQFEGGIASKLLGQGSGTYKPRPENTVVIHFSAWTADGRPVRSSISEGKPARFPLARVPAWWQPVLGSMVVGESRRFWIPAATAYPNRDPAVTKDIVYDIELISIE